MNLPNSYIAFGPVILSSCIGDEIWWKSYDKELTREGLEAIKRSMKLWRDEDYRGTDLFISPYWPEGRLENHCLS